MLCKSKTNHTQIWSRSVPWKCECSLWKVVSCLIVRPSARWEKGKHSAGSKASSKQETHTHELQAFGRNGLCEQLGCENQPFATQHSFEIQPSKIAFEHACVQLLCRHCLVTKPLIWQCALALPQGCLAMDCFVVGFRRYEVVLVSPGASLL